MKIVYYADSITGKVRKKNDDYYKISINEDFAIFIVADGIGGHVGGEIASKMISEAVIRHLLPYEKTKLTHKILQDVMKRANNEIVDYQNRNIEYYLMGSTFSMIIIQGKRGFVVHIGDSRIYSLKSNYFNQVTKDQTLSQALFDSGQITYNELLIDPNRHMLTNYIGIKEELNPSIEQLDVKPGRYLICSDGLYNEMTFEELGNLLYKPTYSLREIGNLMMQKALESGGRDNITFIILEISNA